MSIDREPSWWPLAITLAVCLGLLAHPAVPRHVVNWYTTARGSQPMRWNSLVSNLLVRANQVALVTEVEDL